MESAAIIQADEELNLSARYRAMGIFGLCEQWRDDSLPPPTREIMKAEFSLRGISDPSTFADSLEKARARRMGKRPDPADCE